MLSENSTGKYIKINQIVTFFSEDSKKVSAFKQQNPLGSKKKHGVTVDEAMYFFEKDRRVKHRSRGINHLSVREPREYKYEYLELSPLHSYNFVRHLHLSNSKAAEGKIDD